MTISALIPARLNSKRLDKKLLINVTAGNVIRLLPPLIINKREAKILSDRLILTIESFINNL